MKNLMLVALVISSLTPSVASAITPKDVVLKTSFEYYPATFLAVPNLVASGYAWYNHDASNAEKLSTKCLANFIAPLFACAAYYAGKQPNMIPGGEAGKWGSFVAAALLGGYISEYIHLREARNSSNLNTAKEAAGKKVELAPALARGFGLSALGLAAVELPKYATGLVNN